MNFVEIAACASRVRAGSFSQYSATLPRERTPSTISCAPAPSSSAIGALLALILLSTAVAYLLYFSLLRRIGSTGTASVTFLVPVFGSLWGVLFLHDPFTPGMLLGLALILLSVGFVLRSTARRPV